MDIYKDLYQQLIIDHNKNPRNYRIIENANYSADGHNPLCGDEVTIYITEKEKIIKDISFIGTGCAISQASASIMTTSLKQMKTIDAIDLFNKFHLLATEGISDNNLGKLLALSGIYKYPARVKCATLAWHTFNGALNNAKKIIKTE